MTSHSSYDEHGESTATVDTPDVDHRSAEATSLTGEIARGWLIRLASGDITEEEMRQLKGWLAAEPANREAFAHERLLWRQVQPLRGALAASLWRATRPASELLSRNALRHDAPADRPQRRRRQLIVGGVAGVLAAFFAVLVLIGNPLVWMRADHTTRVGEIVRTTLPDGSIAILNTNSAIAVHFTSDERRIDLLRGEAWFDVQPNRHRPFRVHSDEGIAEAVGTAFSVARERTDTLVRTTKGVVSVSSGRGAAQSPAKTSVETARAADHIQAPTRLTAGEQVRYSENASPGGVTTFEPDVELSWRNRRIVIEDLPLDQALAELDRYRAGRIVLLDRSHAAARVSGTFSIGSLEPSLEELASTQGLHVTYLTRYLAIVR